MVAPGFSHKRLEEVELAQTTSPPTLPTLRCGICFDRAPMEDVRLRCVHNTEFCTLCIDNSIRFGWMSCAYCKTPFTNIQNNIRDNLGNSLGNIALPMPSQCGSHSSLGSVNLASLGPPGSTVHMGAAAIVAGVPHMGANATLVPGQIGCSPDADCAGRSSSR